jgi:hypothetical protein
MKVYLVGNYTLGYDRTKMKDRYVTNVIVSSRTVLAGIPLKTRYDHLSNQAILY